MIEQSFVSVHSLLKEAHKTLKASFDSITMTTVDLIILLHKAQNTFKANDHHSMGTAITYTLINITKSPKF
jgi:hypothetical protein